ncbi:hypothetical protein Tco_0538502 [Tanacetum coccineum]
MANQEQNPPQQEQPFVAAKQVGFNLEDIILNTNNEVTLLYPKHTNKETFKCVSDFISKCFLREPFTRSPNMYKEYLAKFWYSAKALENSKVSFSIPAGASFIIHSESASGDDASANSTAKSDPGKSAPSTDPHVLANQTQSVSKGLESILTQSKTDKGASNIAKQVKEVEASRIIKLEDLAKLMQNVQPSFKDLNSPEDDPIIVFDDSDEDEEADKDGIHATSNIEIEDASVHKSLSPSSLPTELKELPSKFNELTEVVKGLKKQVHELEIELPGDLKEIPNKLEDFTKTAKLQTLDALPSLLNKVTNTLNQFAHAIPSKKTKDASVSSVGQAGTQPAKREKNTNQTNISYDSDNDETHLTGSMVESSKIKKKIKEDAKSKAAKHESEVRKEELIDLLGPEMVNKYYNDKLQYNRYCDKMLNRRAESRITNCDVLTKKGPITLKVYIEDGTSEVIPNLKVNDLHLGE